MTSQSVKTILQKINFIEMDMELHKQILVSIPSDHQEDIKKTIETIACLKNQIQELKQQIRAIDADEYHHILKIETAAETFKRMAGQKPFSKVTTLNESGTCRLTLKDGTILNCLVTAQEENGDWIVLTLDGETKHFIRSDIQESTA